MARINFEILSNGAIDCLEKNCMLSRECANHNTAGDFRMEDGGTPRIFIRDGFLECAKEFLTGEAGMVELAVVKCKPF